MMLCDLTEQGKVQGSFRAVAMCHCKSVSTCFQGVPKHTHSCTARLIIVASEIVDFQLWKHYITECVWSWIGANRPGRSRST